MRVKMMLVLFLLINLSLCSCALADRGFKIEVVDKTETTISLELNFQFDEEQNIYSWRGHIYPILGYALFAVGEFDNGESVTFSNTELVMPKIPYPSDYVSGKNIRIEKPLVLKLDTLFPKQSDCFEIQLIYDTTKMKTRNNLSLESIKSNKVKVCR